MQPGNTPHGYAERVLTRRAIQRMPTSGIPGPACRHLDRCSQGTPVSAMTPEAASTGRELFHTLEDVLRTAVGLVREIGSDPLVGRLLAAFRALPVEDREVIVGVLEREARSREMARTTAESLTGLVLRPNPNARLYVRVMDQEPVPDRRRAVVAAVRAMRLMHNGPLQGDWETEATAALRELEPDERASIEAFNRRMLELIAAASVPRKV